MHAEWYKIILITITGFASGFLNTMAGGDSLIALPVLIFLGLPPAVANGTNRIAIFAQNISGVAGFKSKGLFIFPYNLWLSIAAFAGAILGALIALDISSALFNRILAAIIVLAVLYPILNRVLKKNFNRKNDFTVPGIRHNYLLFYWNLRRCYTGRRWSHHYCRPFND